MGDSPHKRQGPSVTSKLLRAMMLATAFGLTPGLLSAQASGAPAPADLIVTAGRIHTVDPARPLVQALAVRGGRIVFAGSAAEAAVFRGPATRVLDLAGRT